MANTMADTNEQNRTEVNEQTTENERFVLGDSNNYQANANKCRRRLELAVFVCLIFMMVAVVWALVAYPSFPSHFTKPSGSGESSSKISDKTKESTCVYYTDTEYWKSIPDNLNEYCTPKQIPDGDSGHVKKRFQCPGTKLYIPLLCLCDYNVTCPGINNNQEEHYRKKTCKECTAANHCPCQNFGICKNCTEKKSSSLECLCKPGTNGTYCTKISKRLCTKSEESSGLENCNNSNDLECVLRLDETYVCEWKEAMHDNYPNCGLSVSNRNMMKGGAPSSEGMRNSEPPQLTTSKMLLWAIFLLLVVAVILLAIWEFYGKCQTFIKKCRKKKS